MSLEEKQQQELFGDLIKVKCILKCNDEVQLWARCRSNPMECQGWNSEPVSSSIFMVSLALSLPFDKGFLAVHSHTSTSGADPVSLSRFTHPEGGTLLSSHQRQLCHVPGEASQLFLQNKMLPSSGNIPCIFVKSTVFIYPYIISVPWNLNFRKTSCLGNIKTLNFNQHTWTNLHVRFSQLSFHPGLSEFY